MSDLTIYDLLREEDAGSKTGTSPEGDGTEGKTTKGAPVSDRSDPSAIEQPTSETSVWKGYHIVGMSGGRLGPILSGASSRAENDPDGLLADLGVKGASGETPVQKAASIMKAAQQSNDVIAEAFPDSSYKSDIDVLVITPYAALTHAERYIQAILEAATREGLIEQGALRYKHKTDDTYIPLKERDVVRTQTGHVIVRDTQADGAKDKKGKGETSRKGKKATSK
jgi:hypothetical protein